MSDKVKKEDLIIAASNLTVAEMIYGFETDSKPAKVPAEHVYSHFLDHLSRLVKDFES